MNKRMSGPDIIKIAATVFVIFIHHRVQGTAEFWHKYSLMMWGWVLLAAAVSLGLMLWGKKSGWNRKKLGFSCLAPFAFVLSICLLRKYAVTFFFLVSGYMLSKTISKYERPLKDWYAPDNIVSRLIRFYLTLVPVVIVGIIIQVFLKGMSYTPLEVLKLFLLGGFTPGSYYVVVMAQFILIFPLLYVVVKKWRFSGVIFIAALTLIWDVLATAVFKIPVDLYKFLCLRLTTSFALGIYMHRTEEDKNPLIYTAMFIVGLVYVLVFPVWKLLPMPLFYQWQNASMFIGVLLCPVVSWIITEFKKVQYTDGAFSKGIITFSNATYHIFLMQMLYYRMFGYEWNKAVDNIVITMPVNMIVCIGLGILFYKLYSPIEDKIMKSIKTALKKGR